MRFLFIPSLGQGYGHVKRAQLIARQIKISSPGGDISIIADSVVAPYVKSPDLSTVVLPFKCTNVYQEITHSHGSIRGACYQRLIYDLVRSIEPHVAIYDFIISEPILQSVLRTGGRNVILLRRQKEASVEHLLSSGLLDLVSRIIIPHEPKVFRLEELESDGKSINVGPIFDTHVDADKRSVRRRLGVPMDACWIIATCGGGGYLNESELIVEVAKNVAEASKSIAYLCITFFEGVYSPSHKCRADSPIISVHSFDPLLPSYYRSADLILSYTGYNSFYEIRNSGTPAVLIPAQRTLDDQSGRPYLEGTTDAIHICRTVSEAACKIIDVLSGPKVRMRERSTDPPSTHNGAIISARELIRLASDVRADEGLSPRLDTVPEEAYADFKSFFERQFRRGITSFYFDRSHVSPKRLTALRAIELSLNPLNLSYEFHVSDNRRNEGLTFPLPYLKHVNLRITHSCNSRCSFCYHWRSTPSNPHMPILKVADIANQARALGATSIVVNGGEPTLHPDFFEIIELLRNTGFSITVNTNGWRLRSQSFLRSLATYRDLSLFVSILSSDDVGLRGIKDWSGETISLLRELKNNGFPLRMMANIVITKKNIGQLEQMLEHLLEARVHHITMNLIDSVQDIDCSHLHLSRQELEKLYFTIYPRMLFRAGARSIGIKINPIFLRSSFNIVAKGRSRPLQQMLDLARYHRSFEHELANYSRGMYGEHFYGTVMQCVVPKEHIYVMANGDVYPCLKAVGAASHRPCGNLYYRNMRSILCSGRWSEYIEKGGQLDICRICKNGFVMNLKRIYCP